MKKNYLLGYSIIALFLLLTSCSQNTEDEIIPESTKVTIEPDFFKADGSMDNSELEEEAPVEGVGNQKTYGFYNCTLLKPSKDQDKIDAACGGTKTMSLLVGSRKKKVGEVEVSNDDENLYLSFTADEHQYMKKVYLYIGEKGNMPKYSNGYPNLRKFNFKAFPYYFGGTKKAVYTIPLSSINTDCFEIVAYSKVYDSSSRCFYSSFAYDKSLTQTYSYSYYSSCYYYNDWVRSFDYCKQDCGDKCIIAKGSSMTITTYCFSEDGFTDWGWTNAIKYIVLLTNQDLGYTYTLPLYINEGGDICSFNDKIRIGSVELYGFLDNDKPSMSVKYIITDPKYKLSEVSFYHGDDRYPKDNDGNFTISEDYFNYKVDGLDQTEYTFASIPFNKQRLAANSFFIPYAKVCEK